MKTFRNFLFNTNGRREAANRVKKHGRGLLVAILAGLMLIFTVHAQGHVPYTFNLAPTSNTIANCLPNAAATVTVIPREELQGVDTLDLKAEGLLANTTFTVFLTELAEGPFGAAQYIGEFTTNAAGRGSVRVDGVIEGAFSSTVVEGARVRKELNHIVLWFADPAADNVCFAPGTGPTTPFDGDGEAGGTVLSSRNFTSGTPLP